MQAQLRVELDELVVAAEALPLAREKEAQWRVAAEQVAGELSAVRRRCALVIFCVFVTILRRPRTSLWSRSGRWCTNAFGGSPGASIFLFCCKGRTHLVPPRSP